MVQKNLSEHCIFLVFLVVKKYFTELHKGASELHREKTW